MLRSLMVSVLAVTAAFAITYYDQPPVSLTDLPPDVATAVTVQYWDLGDGRVAHTPTVADIEKLFGTLDVGTDLELRERATPMLVPGTELGRPESGGRERLAGLDADVDEYQWPMHGHSPSQSWHNTLEPTSDLELNWQQASAGLAWAPWFGYPVAAAGYVSWVDCFNGNIYVREIADNTPVWNTQIQAAFYFPTSPVIFERNEVLYVAVKHYPMTIGPTQRYMKVYELETGTLVWDVQLPVWNEAINLNLARDIYHDGYIYATMYNNGSPFTGGGVVRVDAATGDTLTVFRDPTRTGTTIGAVTVDPNGTQGYLVLHNFSLPNTWVVKFNLNGTGGVVAATPPITDKLRGGVALNPLTGRLFVTGSASTAGTGYIHAFDKDNLAASYLWRTLTTGGHDIQFTSICDENVYVCTQSTPGRLYGVKQSDGTAAWGTETWITVPGSGPIYDGGISVTGEAGGTKYLYLTPGFYPTAHGFLWVVDANDGSTVQWEQVSATERMFTGSARPINYFLSKSGYGVIYNWEVEEEDIAVKDDDVGVTEILVPSGSKLEMGAELLPTINVYNYGVNNQFSVPVNIQVYEDTTLVYESDYTIPEILSETTYQVVFPDTWYLPDELWHSYRITARTNLYGDQRPGNDFRRLTCIITSDTVFSFGPGASVPVVDGFMAPGEWDDAYFANISNAAGAGGSGPQAPAHIWFKYDNNFAYFAIAFPEETQRRAFDQVGLYIDVNGDGEWPVSGQHEGNYWLYVDEFGDDRILYRPWTQSGPMTPGQVPGSSVASSLFNDYLVFEAAIPLGNLPFQLNIPNRQNHEANLYAYALAGNTYYGWWPVDLDDEEEWNDPSAYGRWIWGTPTLRDVGMVDILDPGSRVTLGGTVWPRVTVRNYGEQAETFNVRVTIEDENDAIVYEAEEEIINLGVGEQRNYTYSAFSWTADPVGDYTVTARTLLVGDANPDNNVVGPNPFVVSERPPWDEGWVEVAPIPAMAGNRRDMPHRGAWLAVGPDQGGTPAIYATKGNKLQNFYRYDVMADTWTELEPAPLDPTRGRPLRQGSRGISDGDNSIYMVHGNNTVAFWHYDIATNQWTALPDVPEGPSRRRVRGGGDMLYIDDQGVGYVYLLKGDRNEFWRFNTETSQWSTLTEPPPGIRPRWQRDSWLAFDGEDAIYALKARYFDRGTETHDFYRYSVYGDSWETQQLAGLPLWGLHNGRIRRRRARDGGAGAYDESHNIYALKGGNSQQFFYYEAAGDSWVESDTMPTFSPTTGRRRRVNAGADLVNYSPSAFFALKGNRTVEFWRYVVPMGMTARRPERSGVMAGTVPAGAPFVKLGPNPLVGGFATLRYSLPKAGPAAIRVFDVSGRNVLSRDLAASRSGAVSLDLRSLSAGVYLVKVEADGFAASQKLVVQK